MRKNIAKILFAAAFFIALPIFFAFAVTKQPFYYGVWLPFWKGQSGAQQIAINLDKLHEVSPFSYEVGAKGVLIDDLNIGNGSWNAWFSSVRDLGIKIIPTIAWFNANGIHALLSNTQSRRAEEDRIKQLVQSQGFDGIDIDFESMLEDTRPYYSLFIEGLAIRLHPLNKLLTCTVIARTPPAELYQTIPSSIIYPENYSVLNQYCDEVRVMAYDQGTIDLTLDNLKGNGNLYAPTADRDWVKSVLKETLRWISPSKIMLGIPTYGYEYQVSWRPGGITTYGRVRAFDFMDAMDRADSLGIQPMRNNANELSFTFASTTYIQVSPALVSTVLSPIEPPVLMNPDPNATTTFFVSFPDSQTMLDKINLAKQFGLRGVIFFKADGNIDPAIWGDMN